MKKAASVKRWAYVLPVAACFLSVGTTLYAALVNEDSGAHWAVWMCAALMAALGITAALFAVRGWGAERRYPVCALLLGLLYLTALTPLSVPDEGHHYQTAYELSNVLLLRADKDRGESADFDYSDFPLHHNTAWGYSRIARDLTAPAGESESVPIPQPRDCSYFLMYLPQALGLALGRLLGLNFIWKFWLGRLCNLLFYVLCTAWAIRLVPRFKALFFLVALAPMSMQQAASFSYDAFINALSLLLLALLLRAMLEGDRPALAASVAVNVLLTPAKLVYYPLAALALLIPEWRFASKRARWGYLLALFVLPLLFLLPFRLGFLAATAVDTGSSLNWEGGHNYTLSFLLSHPAQTAKMFAVTGLASGTHWLKCAVGYLMSGLSLELYEWIPLLYIALLALAGLRREQDAPGLGAVERGVLCASALAVIALVMLTMSLAWTSDTSGVVQGIQGRYFIPILPLLFLLPHGDTLVLRRDIDKELMLAGCLLNVLALARIVDRTLMNL